MRVVLHRLRRLLSWLVFIVLLVAAIVTGVLWLTLPPRSQQARIAGLSGPVDIGFDAVACRSRLRTDECSATGQCIEQVTFTGVRRPGEDDAKGSP